MEADHKQSKKAEETTMQREIAQKYLDSHTMWEVAKEQQQTIFSQSM